MAQWQYWVAGEQKQQILGIYPNPPNSFPYHTTMLNYVALLDRDLHIYCIFVQSVGDNCNALTMAAPIQWNCIFGIDWSLHSRPDNCPAYCHSGGRNMWVRPRYNRIRGKSIAFQYMCNSAMKSTLLHHSCALQTTHWICFCSRQSKSLGDNTPV